MCTKICPCNVHFYVCVCKMHTELICHHKAITQALPSANGLANGDLLIFKVSKDWKCGEAQVQILLDGTSRQKKKICSLNFWKQDRLIIWKQLNKTTHIWWSKWWWIWVVHLPSNSISKYPICNFSSSFLGIAVLALAPYVYLINYFQMFCLCQSQKFFVFVFSSYKIQACEKDKDKAYLI